MTAALGIVLDLKSNTQQIFGGSYSNSSKKRNYDEHDNDIISLASSFDKKYAASGQVGSTPTIFIWDTSNWKLKTSSSKMKLPKGSRGVTEPGINCDNKYLACSD